MSKSQRTQGAQGGGRAERRRPPRASTWPRPRIRKSGTSTAGATSISRPASPWSIPGTAIRASWRRSPQQAQAFAHTCFHVAPYESYVRARRAAECAGARRFPEEDPVPVLRRRGGGERDQDRALLTPSARRSSPSRAAFTGARCMTMALTGKVMPYKRGFGPFPAEVYHAAVPAAVSRHHHRAGARRPRPAVSRRRRSEVGRGDHHRAGAGRGRLQRGARSSFCARCGACATSTASC